MLVLLGLVPAATAGDIVHVAISHEWSERFTRDAASLGPSLKGDVGYGFGIGLGKLIPEVGVGYAYETGVLVPRAGARAILGWLITPGVYAHLNSGIGGPFENPVLGFDGGITLDLSLPYVRLGGFAGVQVFGGPTGPTIPDQNWTAGFEIALSIPMKDDDGLSVAP
jgi:hypothetical protein